ncbi:unnamed protein product [Danaus chrysippus]|uniref:(African queen) hypothetical protein n=1 Tax=Danaus chrysippus TaxID=151541 RepID=A0A8J2QW76_9NEOP|nr:unnamed protein product [Danaus chrysippus]
MANKHANKDIRAPVAGRDTPPMSSRRPPITPRDWLLPGTRGTEGNRGEPSQEPLDLTPPRKAPHSAFDSFSRPRILY